MASEPTHRGTRVGMFELRGPLGTGGMGTVWDAVHVREGVAAAVKLLDPVAARTSAFRAEFRDEVRAAAGLDHPHVVLVLDYGEVTPREARDSGGTLVEGAPYLVMERVHGLSVSAVRGRLRWPELKSILFQVLDALAHAHAAGVVHRDIKPGNVLYDGRVTKLVDFGIAHLDQGSSRPAGTPAYMAPEQFSADWRDLGPPTDLYALGCLAYLLASGQRPFDARGFADLREAHLEQWPEPLSPRGPVPAGFGDWMTRLLQKSPWERYQRAADAAFALHALGDPIGGRVLGPGLDAPSELATLVLDSSMLSSQPTQPLAGTGSAVAVGRFVAPAPPFPRRWQPAERPRRPLPLLGAGLGLFGLRRLPMIGRTAERDTLWSALRTVQRSGRPQVVVLQGPTGCGKSRLSEWLARRAHEVGAASILTAVHEPEGGPADGLVPMMARRLRTVGLSGPELLARLTRLAPGLGIDDPAEVRALVELLDPGAADRPQRREDRHAVLLRTLRRLCDERPQVLLLDDVHWGPDALHLVHALLRPDTRDLPILVVCTVRSEALADQPEAGSLLTGLLERDGVQRLEIDALEPVDRIALVQSLLRMEPGLAAKVVERTDGNPLFAVQLVGDWVHRGLLVPGDQGFRLAPGFDGGFPDDLHAVWSQRIERALVGRPAELGVTLELAAVLGQTVVGAEWEQACVQMGSRADPALVERLLEGRLARPAMAGSAPGWRFVHGMLRESLLRRASEAGRLAALHRAAAAALAALGVDDPPRLGAHLLLGGDLEAAVPVLFRADVLLRGRGELDRSWEVLQELRRALDGLGAPPTDPRRARVRIGEGWVLSLRRQTAEAVRVYRDGLRMAEAAGDPRVEEDACYGLGVACKLAGRIDESRRLLERAVRLAEQLGDETLRANALMSLASTLAASGELSAAQPMVEESLRLHRAHGNRHGEIQALFVLAGNANARGDHQTARRLSEEGLAQSRSDRDPFSVIGFAGMLGDVARHEGHYDEAREHYEECRRVERTVGRERAPITELNLALLDVETGRPEAARRALESLVPFVERSGRIGLAGACRVVLLPCLAESRDWERFDQVLSDAITQLQATGFVEPDLARMAERASAVARAAGETARAERAAALARSQRDALAR